MPKKRKTVDCVVLNDGETYTAAKGSRLVCIPEEEWEASEQDGTQDQLVERYYKEGREISMLAK